MCASDVRLSTARSIFLVATALSLGVVSGQAQAGLLVDLDATTHAYSGVGAEPLPVDLAPAWQGSENIAASFFGSAVLDWAVFLHNGPNGDFQDFLDENNINFTDPSNAGEFVYAYQVNTISSPSFGFSVVTVGKDGDETLTVAPTSLSSAVFSGPTISHVVPGGAADQTTSVAWQFADGANPPVGTGDTTILFFVSPNLPEMDNSSVAIGPTVNEVIERVGSPSTLVIPEPCSLALLTGCALIGLRTRSGR